MSIQTTQSTCSYCGVGCGVVISHDTDTHALTLHGDATHPVNSGMLCAKGMNLHHAVMDTSDRLTTPMMRNHRQLPLHAVSWDDALTRTAKVFQNLIDKFGADSVGFYVSGQLLTEEYYIVNKLVKGFIGTNNIDTNSRLCMSSAVVAYKKSLGEDIVPVCYDDIEHADCIVMAAFPRGFALQREARRDMLLGMCQNLLAVLEGAHAVGFGGRIVWIGSALAIDRDNGTRPPNFRGAAKAAE